VSSAERPTGGYPAIPHSENLYSSAGKPSIATDQEGAVKSIRNAEIHSVSAPAGVVPVVQQEGVLGFVERAGKVFVALAGSRYDRAVEVGQRLSFTEAQAVLAR
jgi:hypothetical protein